MSAIRPLGVAPLVLAAAIGGGCGSSKPASRGSGNAGSPAALSAEAQSAGTGDIPDNQVFLVYRDGRAGYSIKYPEGWTQEGASGDVTFRDKNNLVHIVLAHGGAPSTASVAAQLSALKRTSPTLTFTAPRAVRVGTTAAVKATYTTRSAPNPVTGKRVTLIVDRYELSRCGRVAIVDLGTPKGVDNVDAYRMIIKSFTWR